MKLVDKVMKCSRLFEPLKIKRLTLKNCITMAPLFLGYGNPDGTVSPLMLKHYKRMAASGVSMVVVENAAVSPSGIGSPFTLRIDHDRFIKGLSDLSKAIKKEGAIAFLQINHAGRYACTQERIAPSPVRTGDVVPKEMTLTDIEETVNAFGVSAKRVMEAGFDGVEIHGGTGYLLVQFLSPRTNKRKDEYGGTLQNRVRFPLKVVEDIMNNVGKDYPVGYRFLADEWLADGLHPDETSVYADKLEKMGIAYLSVTAGTHDSFHLAEYNQRERQEAYMAHFAGIIKKTLSHTPVIATGRIQTPETAERILQEGTADLIGIARVLFADPQWPKKAEGVINEPIVKCEPACFLCLKRIKKGKPAFCSRWDKRMMDKFIKEDGCGPKKEL